MIHALAASNIADERSSAFIEEGGGNQEVIQETKQIDLCSFPLGGPRGRSGRHLTSADQAIADWLI